jgi:hypothetical protein
MHRQARGKPHGSGGVRGFPMICANLRADMGAATAKERTSLEPELEAI